MLWRSNKARARRKPRFALMLCAGLTLAVMLNIAMRNDPGPSSRAPAPSGLAAESDVASAGLEVHAPEAELVSAVQRELQAKGYAPGDDGGKLTLQTRAAVLAFETDTGRPLTGMPSEAILKDLLFGTTIVAKGLEAPHVTGEGSRVVREIEARLLEAGFDPGAVDGKLDARTARAIKQYETAHGLEVTGKIGGQLVARLVAAEG
ncbi:MAG: peptidoglycan-binding domain-containing protein [Hyphomicrobiaceae bacterium]